MNDLMARLMARAADLLHRARALVRRHPVRAALLPPAAFALYVLALIPFTPGTDDLRKARLEFPSVVMSVDGVVLAEYKRLNRHWIPLDKVSPHVVNALIATEDRRFRSHFGIDVRRTAGAALKTLSGRRQGGSTITQQLARNLYPEEIGRSLTLTRKLKEAITALKIEAVYSKDEILETYLNTVPFLYNAYGIEMAARTYFDKSAERLDVLEAATLIGMLKGTSYYNPVLNPERSLARRNFVLSQMASFGVLEQKRLAALTQRPLRLDFERQDDAAGAAPHVAQLVRKWLIDWADQRGFDIHADGLVVRTTLHSRMQRAAMQSVQRQAAQLQGYADRARRKGEERHLLQAGLLAVDPRNGHVRAWVGSADYAQSQFDHVAQARRQPGSTFKPFVYGAAYEQGMSPDDTFLDEPVTIRERGAAPWTPRDGSPHTHEPMTLRDGLVLSRNSITAQVMMQVGPERVAQLARALGVRESRLEAVPSLALGTSPVTLREMVAAYASIANGGRYMAPQLILRVEDRKGQVLDTLAPELPEQAMSLEQSHKLVDTLRGVVDRGTGAAIRTRFGIEADVAGKTGTTQDNSDGWFILMHPELVAGAWVGFSDYRVTMADGWGAGARSALPMVGELFRQSLRYRWIDEGHGFDAPRARPLPPAEPDPVQTLLHEVFGRILRAVP